MSTMAEPILSEFALRAFINGCIDEWFYNKFQRDLETYLNDLFEVQAKKAREAWQSHLEVDHHYGA